MAQPNRRDDPRIRKRVRKLHAQGASRNAIARDVGVAKATVSAIAQDLGLSFDRSGTRAATEAAQVDHAARRARLVTRFYDQAERIMDRLDRDEHELADVSAGKLIRYTVRDLPPHDVKALVHSAGHATDKAIRLEAVDAHDGAEEAASMLARLAAGVRTAWQTGEGSAGARRPPDEPETGGVGRDE
ncbi:hypothetical protein [Nocardiopsis rhodophaea]|uniref:hypothetical protein n=1 Tax=Nocardiopsis rhodophaea TaxID=280238 RepID=UPI0031DFC492